MSSTDQSTKPLTLGAEDVGAHDGRESEGEHHVVESCVKTRLQNVVGSARVREEGATPVSGKQDGVARHQQSPSHCLKIRESENFTYTKTKFMTLMSCFPLFSELDSKDFLSANKATGLVNQ